MGGVDVTALALAVEQATPEQAAMLYVVFSQLAALAQTRVMLGRADIKDPPSSLGLTAKQAAPMLGMSVREVYARAKSFPFTFYPMGLHRPRFDQAKLLKWRDAQRG